MKSEIYLLDKKIWKWQKSLVSGQCYEWNDVIETLKFLRMISVALELNKQNPTSHFNILI